MRRAPRNPPLDSARFQFTEKHNQKPPPVLQSKNRSGFLLCFSVSRNLGDLYGGFWRLPAHTPKPGDHIAAAAATPLQTLTWSFLPGRTLKTTELDYFVEPEKGFLKIASHSTWLGYRDCFLRLLIWRSRQGRISYNLNSQPSHYLASMCVPPPPFSRHHHCLFSLRLCSSLTFCISVKPAGQ